MSADRVWLDPAIVVPLVRAAQESDDPARVAQLLNALRPMLLRRLGHRQSPEVAEDLVQVALLKIARSYGEMRPAESVAVGYLVRLVRNVLLDHARSTRRAEDGNRRMRRSDVGLHSEAGPEAVPRAVELRELAVAMRQAVERLPSDKLRAVVLGYLRELTPEEIAANLGITADNVRVRWARAKRLLRSDLASVATDWGVTRPHTAQHSAPQHDVVRHAGPPCADAPVPNESSFRNPNREHNRPPRHTPHDVREVG